MANLAHISRTFWRSFNNKYEPPIQQHLRNVYGCLALSSVAAAVGAAVHLYTDLLSAGFLTSIGAIITFFLLIGTPDNGKNTKLRLGYLLAFAALTGLGMGPLLEMAIRVDPSLVVTALTGTALVFCSFTLCAMLSGRGQWLFLGGILMSVLSGMMLMGIANLLFRSVIVHQAQLYLGLAVMCGFVLYDTQIIVEKRRMGNKDFVTHSMDLFVDLVGIFRRLLIILMQKQEDQKRKRDRD